MKKFGKDMTNDRNSIFNASMSLEEFKRISLKEFSLKQSKIKFLSF